MSIKIMAWVWENSPHKGSALLLLLAIADAANDEGVAWPGLGRLAKKTRLGRRYVIDLVSDLEKSGAIEVQHRRNGELNLSNVYKVVTGIALEVVNHEPPPSEQQTTTPGEPDNTRVVNPSSPKSSIKRNLETSDITAEFLEAWKGGFPDKPQPKPATIRDKLKARMKNPDFAANWKAALERGAATRILHSKECGWFNVTFFLRNDENFQKVLDGWMDWKDPDGAQVTPAPAKQDEGKGMYL